MEDMQPGARNQTGENYVEDWNLLHRWVVWWPNKQTEDQGGISECELKKSRLMWNSRTSISLTVHSRLIWFHQQSSGEFNFHWYKRRLTREAHVHQC